MLHFFKCRNFKGPPGTVKLQRKSLKSDADVAHFEVLCDIFNMTCVAHLLTEEGRHI